MIFFPTLVLVGLSAWFLHKIMFPGRFDPDKWRDVLANMHTVAGTVE